MQCFLFFYAPYECIFDGGGDVGVPDEVLL